MNAPTFTPGPWSEYGPGDPQVYGGDPVRRICVLDRQAGSYMDECYGNAKLIAAAPELYAALEFALKAMEQERAIYESRNPGTGIFSIQIGIARAAIEKARGAA